MKIILGSKEFDTEKLDVADVEEVVVNDVRILIYEAVRMVTMGLGQLAIMGGMVTLLVGPHVMRARGLSYDQAIAAIENPGNGLLVGGLAAVLGPLVLKASGEIGRELFEIVSELRHRIE